ncbi:MAG: sel1 repeat family protein [Magnetococcales bacterium]|nr:sel1 repeat family protein [Magnetococcales bacterium]
MNAEIALSNPPDLMNVFDIDENEYASTLATLAEWGDAKAQHNLGAMFLEGLELPRDYAAAMEWYEQAARQGYAPAQYDIGTMFLEGLGVEPDPVRAAEWFLLAAHQSDAKAQNNLGILCATGEGMPQNMIQARMWFLLATRGGLDDARDNLELSAEEMTPDEIDRAEQLAREWRPSS